MLGISLVGVATAATLPASGTPAAGFHLNASATQTAGGYTPEQLRAAYNVTPLLDAGNDGTGQTMAIIALDAFSQSDIDRFDAEFDLPSPDIQVMYVGGRPFRLPVQGETDMDIEWAHAMAPGAKILVYYVPTTSANANGWQAIGSAVDGAVAAGATTISMSFGTCGPTRGYTATSSALARAYKAGVSVFVSSGDDGSLAGPEKDCGSDPGVSYPASDPSVVSVGGTSLLLTAANNILREVAWTGSGGGKALGIPRPTWQVAATLKKGKYRYAPDVSFLANQTTGAAMVYRGRWIRAGGTSLGAPAWAAMWTLVRSSATSAGMTLTAAPPVLYRIGNSSQAATAYHDITTGTNGTYKAKIGWDAVTGWGTPNLAGLAAAITQS